MKRKKRFFLIVLSFFSCKNEPICVVDENNAGKEIYDLEEATCFIALKLNKKKSDLSLIRDALVAEMDYMDKLGLNSNSPDPESVPESNVTLDIHHMVEHVQNEGKVNLTKNDLIEIYATEIEYLMFIGVVDE